MIETTHRPERWINSEHAAWNCRNWQIGRSPFLRNWQSRMRFGDARTNWE